MEPVIHSQHEKIIKQTTGGKKKERRKKEERHTDTDTQTHTYTHTKSKRNSKEILRNGDGRNWESKNTKHKQVHGWSVQ